MKKAVSAVMVVCLTFVTCFSMLFLTNGGKAYAAETKIVLTPSMVTNESGLGDATMLVDEQTLAGDPANGTGGDPVTHWQAGWNSSLYPAYAYIDLGQSYNLTSIYLRDTHDMANITLYSGSPGNWTTLFTDPLSGWMTWNAHPVSVTTRYVRVALGATNTNMTEVVIYGTAAASGDTTAPAAIANLAAPSSTSSSVSLTWTAPGDDGSTGTASSYDIRYSTSAITSSNWASATQVTGEPTPAAAGTNQSMSVDGLAASTTYYFAMKASDEVPNISGLSNAVSKATTAASSGKITLTAPMVVNESGLGDATLLVDEQATAGDPAGGTGGAPTTNWQAGWNSSLYPAHAYIDLGQNYDLTSIYLRDTYGIADITISAGSPGNWTSLFTDPLTGFMTWNAHPVTVTTRYVRVSLSAPNVNMTEIVLYGSPAGGGGGDTTAPADVTNLAAPSSTGNSVNLTWTAPGDDGTTGTAASYDIRYSTSAITSGTWATATQVTGEPAPAAAGTAQSLTVNGLAASTTYYFALKTKDEVPNESGLSNVVSKATTASTSTKITLTASMILNEVTGGDATLLVDEQTLSGDPKAGIGGNPTTFWNAGYFVGYQPASAVIDLGTNYQLTDVYLYDGSGGGNMSVSAGTPFNWTQLFTDPLSQQNQWRPHSVNITTRYVQVKFDGCCRNMHEIVLYGTPLGTPETPPTPTPHALPTMDQLIGINAFIDDPQDKMLAAGFVREYHNWFWDEGDAWDFKNHTTVYPGYPNNANKFNPSYAGGGTWNFDAYYQNLKAAGLTVSPAIQGSVDWLSNAFGNKPISTGEDPLLPSSYAEHADHMFQFAARYGSTAVADSKLKLASGQPRSTGLNTLKYFEDWNEQDAWWSSREVYFNPYEYAAMASADYDGHLGTMGNTVGVKNADPNAKLVMGGLADPDLEYIRALKFWADWNRSGSVPFDVLNIHLYSNDGTDQQTSTVGVSPETGLFKEKLQKFVDYRNRYLPGKEMWITEFGYDTYSGSAQRAPAIGLTSQYEVQAQWLVRSYLAAAAAGVDKAAMFMLRDNDVEPASRTRFDDSGLISSKNTGSVPKISWYYVYTLKNRLTGMKYLDEQSSGNSNVKIYKFKSATGSNGGYVIWCPTSNNTTVSNYQLTLAGTPTTATSVTMASGDTDGVPSALTISGGKVNVNVSERPIFVMVDNIQ
ncbi:fibronectin type III domain-containing protein [Cohnella silvisoli]|uniref:Fibronectin type-III domain-containing protein n=1 Tax=Cohnella silvisoli TaxID=2873699 RepID=A0ABV1L1R0_9BACL|nr:hypothetical protein [Cohnella silvisoli]MCD9025942.1 hypothetical protein [Cohnella silvisoli]